MRSLLVPVVLAVLLAPTVALARHGGLYFELAPSFGIYATNEVVIEEGNDDFGDFPVASFVPALKLGVNLFGWAGVEAHATGHFWDLENDRGGAAYAGAVLRITPLEALSYILPDTVQLPSWYPPGPVSFSDRPFDLGVSFGGGYSIVGEDYAYQGGYFQWGLDVKWYLTPNFALGLDLPFRHMQYEPFRYANYGENTGYCTDGADAYGFVGNQRFAVSKGASRAGPQINAGEIDERCEDPAPSALFFAPAITIAGVFDFGI